MTRRILVFEWICGGGITDAELREKLRPEGRAMLRAVAEDVGRLHKTTAVVPVVDSVDLAEVSGSLDVVPASKRPWRELLSAAAEGCSAAIVIAPETDGILTDLAYWFESDLPQVLWCGPDACRVGQLSDKIETRDCFDDWNLPRIVDAYGREHPVPVVVKPEQSCGSDRVRKINAGERCPNRGKGYFVEEFVEGQPCSVFGSVIGSGKQELTYDLWPLVEQQIDEFDGCFSYRGGALTIPGKRQGIAAPHVKRSLGNWLQRLFSEERTSLGIDFIDRPSGAVILEVNPRVTTSYIGYRAATYDNLAEWLLGEATRPVRWNVGTWSWTPDGVVTRER